MSEKYKVLNPEGIYFITITVVGWVDLFIRREYKNYLIESLEYCQKHKGLKIYGWVFMTSHIHMIVSATNGDLPDIIRDFKTHTSKALIKLIKEIPESRREWVLKKFAFEANRNVRGTNYKLWQDGFHPVELSDNKMQEQRIDYVHNNPVEAGFVETPSDYLYSSARDYEGVNGFIKVDLIQ